MTDGVVLITTSPIPSHPSTAIIDATIASVHERTDWPILVVADGVRPELEHRRGQYERHLEALAGLRFPRGFVAYRSPKWLHQAGIVAEALDWITPGLDPELLLFLEHDTPLVGEWPWEALCAPLLDGTANVVRAYHEKVLVAAHGARIVDREPLRTEAGPLYRTRQWSQRPHLARVDYYRRILNEFFPPDARTMIEDRMHGVIENVPWEDHRVWLWLPKGDYPDGTGLGTQRSDHLDGRADDPKLTMDFGAIG